MKKAIASIVILLLNAAILGGCATSGSTLPPSPTATPPSPTITTAASPSLSSSTPEPVQLSTDIPDVAIDPNEYMDYSDTSMHEDADNLYTIGFEDGKYPLCAISKKTGEITKIAGDIYEFTYSKGYIFWIEFKATDADGNGEFKTLYRYDVKTKANQLVKKFKKTLYGLIEKDEKLYLLYERYTDEEQMQNGIDWFSDLYSLNSKGSGMCKVIDDAYVVASYKGRLYTTRNTEFGENVDEYDPASGNDREVTRGEAYNSYFAIGYGKLFYDDLGDSLIMTDLKTLQETELAKIKEDAFAVLGQYLFYITMEEPDFVMAYDIQNGKKYRVAQIGSGDGYTPLKSTRYNIYIHTGEDEDAITGLYRIVIEGGKGRLEKVVKQ